MGIEIRLKKVICHEESSERGGNVARRLGSDELLLLVSAYNSAGKSLGTYKFLKTGVDSGNIFNLDEVVLEDYHPAQEITLLVLALELDGPGRSSRIAERIFKSWNRVAKERLLLPEIFGGTRPQITGDDKFIYGVSWIVSAGSAWFADLVQHDLLGLDQFSINVDLLRNAMNGRLPDSVVGVRPVDSRNVTVDTNFTVMASSLYNSRRYKSAEAHSDYSFEFAFRYLPYKASYRKLAGSARDIGIGGPLPFPRASIVGYGIPTYSEVYGWDGKYENNLGCFIGDQIAVDPEGGQWIVHRNREIWRPSGQVAGSARDIAIGANGSVYIIGTDNPSPGNGGIYLLQGSRWLNVGGYGVRVAVDPEGGRWVVNSGGEIWSPDGQKLPGCGRDIGIGYDGSIYVIGCDRVNGGDDGFVYLWNGRDWENVGGYGVALSVDALGRPWVVNSLGEIYAPEEN